MKKDIDQIMEANNTDALWITGAMYNNSDMVYFTGIHHANQVDLFKLCGKEPIAFHMVSMEREEAARSGLEIYPYDEKYPLNEYLKQANGDLLEALGLRMRDVLQEIGLTKGRVALSGMGNLATAYAIIEKVKTLMPEIEFFSFLKDSPNHQARMTKTADEANHIRKMAHLTTEVVGRTAEFLGSQHLKDNCLVDRNGDPITIGNVKQLINLWLAELGADNPEETVFSIGRDAGIPHNTGNPQDILQAGKTIVFDIFPCEKGGGYFYDFTRTWCLAFASDEIQKFHEQVLSVHHQIIAELQPMQSFKTYQTRTCQLFSEMGHMTIEQDYNLTEGYVHSIGHGLGLDVHENPFSGTTASKSDVLAPGSVFSIEPGLYYPSKGMGIRIEDTVYLNSQGKFEILADYPYDLILPIKN